MLSSRLLLTLPHAAHAGMIITSALMIWKGLVLGTGSESPVGGGRLIDAVSTAAGQLPACNSSHMRVYGQQKQ